MMLEELGRNYSKSTTRYHLQAVANFARHFGKSPDQLGPDERRSYQAYLLRERKLAVGKRRFEELLNEQFAAEDRLPKRFMLRCLFCKFSNLPLVADLLRTRISRETKEIREIAEIRKQLGLTPATDTLHRLNLFSFSIGSTASGFRRCSSMSKKGV
jgi:hypothetical protein